MGEGVERRERHGNSPRSEPQKCAGHTDDTDVSAYRRSWLCPTEGDFARTMETYAATHRARIGIVGGAVVLVAAFAPRIGWWPFVLSLVIGVQLLILDRRMPRARRPEWWLAASYTLACASIAVGVAMTGGAESPMLPMFGIPMLLLANRFRRHVTMVGLAGALAMMLIAASVAHSAALVRDPTMAICTAVLMVGIIVLTLPQYEVELGLRTEGHADALTGLLNRSSLDHGFTDACAAAAVHGRPVSLVLFDLDDFKSVNDRHGHDAGDRVLCHVADVIARHARAGDQVYRLGGEEIGVVLSGAGIDESMAMAQRQREAVAAEAVAGVRVTMSGGVASRPAADARWGDLYRAADQALLRAKADGRDRLYAEAAGPGAQAQAVGA